MKKIVLVTGRSGSGKTSTLQVLEDLGYYTIDNLPISLVPGIVAKLDQDNAMELLALGVDIRSLQNDQISIDEVLDELQHYGVFEVIYLTSREDVLLARYASSRRPHPLATKYDSLTECIRVEEQLLYPIYRRATLTIDTSNKNVHDLRHTLSVKLGQGDKLVVILQSFGFKHGLPLDTDYVFDLRHLINPHWISELRAYSGLDIPVQEFLAADDMVNDMYEDIEQFLQKWLPVFSQGHRQFITISFGCTGGQHRSVYFVDRLAKALQAKWSVQVLHREMKHWS
ncbi:RNase adapter RapZ [Acinetobacter qingfengensis]|uniref:RNase adaptor protein RapZ n=1 Tax=Acinetobacter qingfengensis TaxID=1262585 RepID=A0A1E7QXE4_9GAMM|nr:RNase adapter RapZ [Acinetobacter qingfengensis]KAA8731620.1 RNase adapter RapZ [Acinetobacter qingfengensis]OEY91723.1 RNase adaptor protein RapZ [Acinetobacter qingfengensis]